MDDSGLANRVARMTKVSIGLVIVEGAVFLESGQRCPLMDLAEEMGSEHGDVGDIFLPNWLAKRIPIVSSTLAVLGLAAMEWHHLAQPRRRSVGSSS